MPTSDLAGFLDAREAALDGERARLAAIGSGTLDSEIGGTITELMVRVPAYVDWVYDWIDGYIAAFRVLGRGGHAWFAAEKAGTAALVPSVAEAMHEVSAEQLDKLVVGPVDPAARLQKAFSRVDARFLPMNGAACWRAIRRDGSTSSGRMSRPRDRRTLASEGTSVGCTAEPPAAQSRCRSTWPA